MSPRLNNLNKLNKPFPFSFLIYYLVNNIVIVEVNKTKATFLASLLVKKELDTFYLSVPKLGLWETVVVEDGLLCEIFLYVVLFDTFFNSTHEESLDRLVNAGLMTLLPRNRSLSLNLSTVQLNRRLS